MLKLSTRNSLKEVVNYAITDERNHLIEDLYTQFGEEESFEDFLDEDLLDYCVKHDFDHIWIDYYRLSLTL